MREHVFCEDVNERYEGINLWLYCVNAYLTYGYFGFFNGALGMKVDDGWLGFA